MKLVFIDKLKPGMVAKADVFPPNNHAVPYIRAGTILTNRLIDEIHRLKIQFVSIEEVLPETEKELPGQQSHFIKPGPVISPELKREAVDSLKGFFSIITVHPDDFHASAQILKQIDTVVDQLVESLQRNEEMLVNINDLKSYDDYTFHHSLSVAVLSIAIGKCLGLNRAQLNQIGMCSMMHDIGKTAVPIEIIHKTSRLNDNEFKVVKTHSSAGYNYLHNAEIGNEELWRGVLHHHEKYDGTGYPRGIKGEEIPLFSRIISVGDVYDALTSNRPYRTPMQPSEAIEYIMGGGGAAFDFDIVNAFIKMVDVYPVGSKVLLSNGMVATVVNNQNQIRPVVRLDSGEFLDLFWDRGCLNIVISRFLSSGF